MKALKTDQNTKHIGGPVPIELYKQLAVKSIMEEKTIQTLLTEAIELLIKAKPKA